MEAYEEDLPLEKLRSLEWSADHVKLGDLTLQLQDKGERFGPDSNLVLYKSRGFVRNYESLLASRPDFRARRMLELGIWRGGSIALWNEVFRPDSLAAIDILPEAEPPALTSYMAKANRGKISLHWNASQDDVLVLDNVLAEDFGGLPPDIVIDDASHQYWPTRRSFEWLFPRMKPGALYVIEDWRSSVDAPSDTEPLHRIASDLVFTLARGQSPLSSVTARHGIVVVERGRRPFDPPFVLAREDRTKAQPRSLRSRLRQLLR
jgi:hypothetical protein